MHYRSLGRTGIPVSTVAMGTWQSFDVRSRCYGFGHVPPVRRGYTLVDGRLSHGPQRWSGYAAFLARAALSRS